MTNVATLSQAKTLGGLGSILIFIPFLSIVGYILIIVAVREISEDLHDKTIFRNVVIAALTGIVGAFGGAIFVIVGLVGVGTTTAAGAAVSSRVGVLGGGLLIAWIALIVSAVFLRRAYNSMAKELGVGAFRTAATLYFIGAILTVIIIGFLILFVAEIVQAIAYFSIPNQPPQAQGTSVTPGTMDATASSMPPQGAATKFCTNCGTKISPSATFCYSCGAKQS